MKVGGTEGGQEGHWLNNFEAPKWLQMIGIGMSHAKSNSAWFGSPLFQTKLNFINLHTSKRFSQGWEYGIDAVPIQTGLPYAWNLHPRTELPEPNYM